MSDKYNSLLDLVSRGATPYGERLAGVAAMDSFFLRRGRDEVKAMFPVSEQVQGPVLCLCSLFDNLSLSCAAAGRRSWPCSPSASWCGAGCCVCD